MIFGSVGDKGKKKMFVFYKYKIYELYKMLAVVNSLHNA